MTLLSHNLKQDQPTADQFALHVIQTFGNSNFAMLPLDFRLPTTIRARTNRVKHLNQISTVD